MFTTFKSTASETYDASDDAGKQALVAKMADGGLQVWQSSVWQSSVWQSSVWQSSVWESRAFRIMQNSIWQSSVWEDYFWVGKVWRMNAAVFKKNSGNDGWTDTTAISWKSLTLKPEDDGGSDPYISKQMCPPLHLKSVKDKSFSLLNGNGTPKQMPSNGKCFPESINLPKTGLGEGVHVFIFDTGVDVVHPDLMGAVYNVDHDASWTNLVDDDGYLISDNGHYNAVGKEAECDIDVNCILKYGSKSLNSGDQALTNAQYCLNPLVDCHGHGTHTASLAVGALSGVAKKAILHSVRVANCKGVAETEDIVRGLEFVKMVVKQNNWKAVVSLSLGGAKDDLMESKLTEVINLGIPAVCAAGNTAQDSLQFSPAGLDSCITVGAADPLGNAATFSNYGPALNVFAPGVDVTTAAAVSEICRDGMYDSYGASGTWPTLSKTTYPGDDIYTTASGTSFACPIVTGIVAARLSESSFSSNKLTFSDGKSCVYLPPTESELGDGNQNNVPCSLLMQAYVVQESDQRNSLKYRTPSTDVEYEDGSVSTGSFPNTGVSVSDTTTNFAQWNYDGESRRRNLQESLPNFLSRSLSLPSSSTSSGSNTVTYKSKVSFQPTADTAFADVAALSNTKNRLQPGAPQNRNSQHSLYQKWKSYNYGGAFGDDMMICFKDAMGGVLDIEVFLDHVATPHADIWNEPMDGNSQLGDGSTVESHCKQLPLSITLYKWVEDENKIDLVYENDNIVYSLEQRNYVYSTKVKVPKGCYMPALTRYRTDWMGNNLAGRYQNSVDPDWYYWWVDYCEYQSVVKATPK